MEARAVWAFLLLVTVCQAMLMANPLGASAQNTSDCVLNLDLDYHLCRYFDSDDGSNRLVFEVYWIEEGAAEAARAFEAMKQNVLVGLSSGIDPYPNSKPFGDDRIAFKYDIAETGGDAVFIAFQMGEFLAIWTALGTAVDALGPFRAYYDDYVNDPSSLDLNAQLNQLLPRADQLPGYSLVYEEIAAAPSFFDPLTAQTEAQVEPTKTAQSMSPAKITVISDEVDRSNGFYTFHIVLRNDGGEVAPMVTVTVTCEDISETLVASNVGYVQNLQPGQVADLVVKVPEVNGCFVLRTEVN